MRASNLGLPLTACGLGSMLWGMAPSQEGYILMAFGILLLICGIAIQKTFSQRLRPLRTFGALLMAISFVPTTMLFVVLATGTVSSSEGAVYLVVFGLAFLTALGCFVAADVQ